MKEFCLAFLVILLASVFTVGCLSSPTGEATLIVAVKDAPKITEMGTIHHLNLTLSEVSVHRASGNEAVEISEEEETVSPSDTRTDGWFVVVDTAQTADLIALQNVSQVLGQKVLDAGDYTQIRLKIDSGNVMIDGVSYPLIVPSEVLKLNRGFTLAPDGVLKLTLDFNVERSLIMTGSGQYKLEPVIAVISE